MENKQKKDNWKVTEIRISYHEYGEDKGKYAGHIEFENGDDESFKFKIRPNMADKYIDLLAVDIVKSATELGQKLIKSLGLDNEQDT